MAHQFFLRHDHAKHLPFDGTGRERVRTDLPSPGSRTVDDDAAANRVLLVRTPAALPSRNFHRQHMIAGREIDAAMLCGGDRGCRQMPRIDAALFQEQSVRRGISVRNQKRRLQFRSSDPGDELCAGQA